jgi:hypothetical protein
LGKESTVFSMGGYTAQELHESAQNYFFLERIKTIWTQPKTRKKLEKSNKDDAIEKKEPIYEKNLKNKKQFSSEILINLE